MNSPFQEEQSSLGKDRSHMTEKILNLTLEIIYLLSGEDYILVKTFGELVTPSNRPRVVEGWSRIHSPITVPALPSPTPERNSDKKILEVTQKIIELLTGEVPIRCQDVTVYFSMEEWEYIEGHKDLYRDIMMENGPPLTSPDGSSNRNPPERCHRPLYSRDSTQEHQEIPQKDHSITQVYKDENLFIIKVEEDERDNELDKEEDIPPEISTEEEEKIRNKYPIFSPEGDVDEDVTAEENRIALPHLHPNLHGPDLSSNSDAYNSALIGGASLISQQRTHNGKKRYSCSECGKCFAQKSGLGRHERNHRGNYDYTCSHCGKSFTQKAYLVVHERIHTKEKPFSCSVCGKCFNQKPNLLIHERIHSDVKPYTCSACGKCFKYKSSFTLHERLHTGDKPFSCPICSKRFSKKSSLVSHERRHIGQKPLL
ncbi:gastrula zinc finger protein XlCGF66.1-like isoform X2 [Aquarana catesbeiana]